MSRRADSPSRPVGGAVRVLVAVVAAAVVVATTTVPAAAVHQNCGDRYPDGTLSNGHPDMDAAAGKRGWSGERQLYQLEASSFAMGVAKSAAVTAADVVKAVGELPHDTRDVILNVPDPAGAHHAAAKPAEGLSRGFKIAGTVLYAVGLGFSVIETSLLARQRVVARAVSAENACNGVLGGDMVDAVWVGFVERSLASMGPPPAILLTPGADELHPGRPEWPLRPRHHKGDFPWCPPVAGSDDCTPQYHTGFLDAPDVGVRAVVTAAIGHVAAHGVKPADVVAQANLCVAAGDGAIGEGRYKAAFAHYRLAYQWALGITVPSTSCGGAS